MFRVCATDERGVKAEIKVAETGPPMLFTSLVNLIHNLVAGLGENGYP
jgi:hypothetical protein